MELSPLCVLFVRIEIVSCVARGVERASRKTKNFQIFYVGPNSAGACHRFEEDFGKVYITNL